MYFVFILSPHLTILYKIKKKKSSKSIFFILSYKLLIAGNNITSIKQIGGIKNE